MISIEHHNIISSSSVNINVHEIHCLKGFYKKTLDLLLSFSNNYFEIFPSRETIALKVGCTPHHIDKILTRLENIGVIEIINRGYRVTNSYKISDIFFLPEIREQLAKFFSSLTTWGMSSLMRAAALYRKSESLLNGILFNNLKLPVYQREWSAMDDISLVNQSRKEMSLESEEKITVKPSLSTKVNENAKFSLVDTIYCESGAGLNSNIYFPDHEKIESDRERREVKNQEYLKQLAERKESKRLEEERFRLSPKLTKEQAYELFKKNEWI
jgi:DNA-binding transcriptional regulator YhcF (GntR family)